LLDSLVEKDNARQNKYSIVLIQEPVQNVCDGLASL